MVMENQALKLLCQVSRHSDREF